MLQEIQEGETLQKLPWQEERGLISTREPVLLKWEDDFMPLDHLFNLKCKHKSTDQRSYSLLQIVSKRHVGLRIAVTRTPYVEVLIY